MTVQYISVSRVKEAMRSSYDGADDSVLSDILTSCCAFLDTYCNRNNGGFAVQNYDELYSGTGTRLLYLNNSPLVSISRIATAEQPAMSVKNNSQDMGTRATAQITSTGLTLTYIASAVTTTNTFAFTSYPTVNQLVAAVNGAGNNWTANVMGGFGTWASADLRATQGAYGSRVVTSYFWIHWFDVPSFRVYEPTSEVYCPSGFSRGVFNWRITYQAGYPEFPDDLAQALAELVAQTYYVREANANMSNESLGGYSYSRLTQKAFDGLSDMAKKTMAYYKVRRVPKFSTW